VKYTPRELRSNVNVTPTSPLKEFVVLTAGILGIVVALYLLLGLAVDVVVPRLSVDFEKRLAGPFLQAFDAKDDIPDQRANVQALVDDIQTRCTHLPYEFKVHVRKSPVINAVALPGGHILVFTGLLDQVTSENELAFVLGHELGHYARRDHLRGAGRSLVLMALSVFLFGPDSSVSDMLSHGLNITELSFSRKQETQADEFALETMNCTYGHVAGATDFFEKIPKNKDPGRFGHYFSSHPENRRRIAHLKDLIREKGFRIGERRPITRPD
jgi:Zn-dependent protease with chaperone function